MDFWSNIVTPEGAVISWQYLSERKRFEEKMPINGRNKILFSKECGDKHTGSRKETKKLIILENEKSMCMVIL